MMVLAAWMTRSIADRPTDCGWNSAFSSMPALYLMR
jgi:hypothetical protein